MWIGWPTYLFRLPIWNWQWRTLQTLIILMIVTRLASSKQCGPYSRHSVPSCGRHRNPWPRAWPGFLYEQIDDQDMDQSDYYIDYQQRQRDSPCGNNHTHSQPDLHFLETCNFGVLHGACFLGVMQILSWFILYSKQMSACLSFTAFRKLTDNVCVCSGPEHGAWQLGAWCNVYFISSSQDSHAIFPFATKFRPTSHILHILIRILSNINIQGKINTYPHISDFVPYHNYIKAICKTWNKQF